MLMNRRRLLIACAAFASMSPTRGTAAGQGETRMFGLLGKMTAAAGQRDALIDVLLAGINDMPGCLSYVVARDAADPDAIWVTEVWESEGSHKASLALPAVRAAIAKARPLIAGFGDQVRTVPVGGHGLRR